MPLLILLVLVFSAFSQAAAQETRLLLTVTTSAKYPLPGARIQIVREDTGRIVATATSNDAGAAEILVNPQRAYVISVSLAGYSFAPIHPAPPPGDVAIVLMMSENGPLSEVDDSSERFPPGQSALAGFVRSTSGRPLADITVEAVPTDPPEITGGRTRTRGDGSYRMAVPSGNYIVRASGAQGFVAPELLTSSSHVAYERTESLPVFALAGYAATVNLQMTPIERAFPVTVVVLDDFGKTLPGASVEWFGVRETTPRVVFHGRRETGAKGSLPLGAVSPGPMTILATAVRGNQYLAGTASVEVLNARMNDITVRMLPGARVIGRVEFVGGDGPVHGADGLRVSLERPEVGAFRSSADPGLMDLDGRFSLGAVAGDSCVRVTGIPPGWRLYRITRDGEDLTNRVVRFDSPEVYDILVSLGRGDEPGERPSDCEP